METVAFGDQIEIENAAYEEELRHFAAVVRGREQNRLTGLDGLRCVETLEAIGASLDTGLPAEVVHHDVESE